MAEAFFAGLPFRNPECTNLELSSHARRVTACQRITSIDRLTKEQFQTVHCRKLIIKLALFWACFALSGLRRI
jgi:hypothetical protein